jgi:hypothetical protein
MLDSLLCGFGALTLIIGLIGVGLGIVEIDARIEERRRRRDRRMPVAYVRTAAVRSVREIRRQAIRDLLDAERGYRQAGYGDVIEGTAVEVER